MPPTADPGGASGSGEVVWTIVVAGGSGRRFGGHKQFESVGGQRMVDLSVATAQSATEGVVVVVPSAVVDEELARHPGTVVVAGGDTRSASVRAGLVSVPPAASIVCVHDAARPFASAEMFAAVIQAVRAGADGAVPGVPVTDTIKRIDDDGCVIETPPRERLVAVQTPQAFRAAKLRSAHAGAGDATDDAGMIEALGGRVVVVAGESTNRKITAPDDLEWARRRIAASR